MGINLSQGRDLSPAIHDTHAGLVNQTLVESMGWTDPIGKLLTYPNDPEHIDTIVGVVDDYHFHSLHQQIEPLVLFLPVADFTGLPALSRAIQISYLVIKTAGNGNSTLPFLQEKWREYDPRPIRISVHGRYHR